MISPSSFAIRPRLGWLAAGTFAGLVLAVAFAPALAPRPTSAVDSAGTTPEHTISVSGVGRVTTVPDVADVSVGVNITRTKISDAQAAAATAMNAVLAALREAGVADKDIQTTSLSLQPVYDYSNNNSPRLTGYQISNTVTATVRQLDTISAVVDGALNAGANTLNGITFRLDDSTAAEAQARDAAMTNARAEADALARDAGVTISGVASISEQSVVPPTPQPYFAAAGAALDKNAPSTPFSVGTNEVDVTVNVVYLIN
jgi:uncharacterized protein YggE